MTEVFVSITISIATLGFLIWFWLSSSLNLPVRFQIMYDSNPPYVLRILSRRILAIIIFGLLPFCLIKCTNWMGRPDLSSIGVSFDWNNRVLLWLAILVPAIIIFHFFTAAKTSNLEQFPLIRVRFWRPHIIFWSAFWWILSLIAYEFFYRGLLLESLRDLTGHDQLAILMSAGLYALTHYFKRNRSSVVAVIYGVLACIIVIDCGSILPVIIIQIVNALSNEWLSIYFHPEMHARNT